MGFGWTGFATMRSLSERTKPKHRCMLSMEFFLSGATQHGTISYINDLHLIVSHSPILICPPDLKGHSLYLGSWEDITWKLASRKNTSIQS